MTEDSRRHMWAEVDALEQEARGMFVGGMLVDSGIDVGMDSGATSTDIEDEHKMRSAITRAFLTAMGATPTGEVRAASIEAMRQEIARVMHANARVAMITARNLDSLPEDVVESIYDELAELEQLV
jgi:predicted aspartyl protease